MTKVLASVIETIAHEVSVVRHASMRMIERRWKEQNQRDRKK